MWDRSRIEQLWRQIQSFSLIGAIMTATTLSISFYLLKYVGTPLIPTYVAVYGTSILVSYILNSVITFRSALRWKRAALYFAVYLSSMGIGVLLLTIYKSQFSFENWVYPFMVVPFTACYNFWLSSRYLKADAQKAIRV